MNLFVQNLTKQAITFQNKVIDPYDTVEYTGLTDPISLARLFNAGKITYTYKKVVVATECKKVETVQEPTVEVFEQKNDTANEETVSEVVEDLNKVEEYSTETNTVEKEPVKPAKRNRKAKEDK